MPAPELRPKLVDRTYTDRKLVLFRFSPINFDPRAANVFSHTHYEPLSRDLGEAVNFFTSGTSLLEGDFGKWDSPDKLWSSNSIRHENSLFSRGGKHDYKKKRDESFTRSLEVRMPRLENPRSSNSLKSSFESFSTNDGTAEWSRLFLIGIIEGFK